MSRTTPGEGAPKMSVGRPALTKMRGGVGRGPSRPTKCQSEGGPGLTFPNVKNDAGKHKSTKSQCFFEGVAGLMCWS